MSGKFEISFEILHHERKSNRDFNRPVFLTTVSGFIPREIKLLSSELTSEGRWGWISADLDGMKWYNVRYLA